MSLLHVVSASPGAGRTGVAAALARFFAYQGVPAGLLREPGGPRAAEDATLFSSLPFVRETPSSPLAPGEWGDRGEAERLFVAERAPGAAASQAVVVARPGEAGTLQALSENRAPVVVLAAPESAVGDIQSEFAGFNLVAVVPEDRALFGPSVAEVQAELGASVLAEGDRPADATLDHVIVASISSDPGQPYFRRFNPKAVIVRFDKTDLALAAMASEVELLILSGGGRPSDYLIDRAESEGVPVLLSQKDTLATAEALEGIYEKTRFQGERKLERLYRHLEEQGAFAAIARALGVGAPA